MQAFINNKEQENERKTKIKWCTIRQKKNTTKTDFEGN